MLLSPDHRYKRSGLNPITFHDHFYFFFTPFFVNMCPFFSCSISFYQSLRVLYNKCRNNMYLFGNLPSTWIQFTVVLTCPTVIVLFFFIIFLLLCVSRNKCLQWKKCWDHKGNVFLPQSCNYNGVHSVMLWKRNTRLL